MNIGTKEIDRKVDETEGRARVLTGWQLQLVALVAFIWSLFQLWYASPLPFIVGFGVLIDVPARAIHLGFALFLTFLSFPFLKRDRRKKFGLINFCLAIVAFFCTFYLFYNYEALVYRNGVLLTHEINIFGRQFNFPTELILGMVGILLLLESTRRAIGTPLVIVALIFLLYSIFGQSMPEMISHQGLSLKRLVGYHWFGGEAIFGIPISVSVSFVFLFVLFGSMLDFAGGGRYFLSLALALVGKFRGGPAKASILASGLTGMISGSSIANVVTTGTFTIPIMKKTGFPAVKAGAIEVAASVNGQIMPPIMGAAAFIIAEMLGITYFQVITHAFIPAIIIYLSLFWISDLEASKLGLKGMDKNEIPELGKTFRSGIHFLIPIALLIYLLIIKRWTAGSAVFYSILAMMAIMIIQKIDFKNFSSTSLLLHQIGDGFKDIARGMIRGAVNMTNVAIAIGTAGIIVGAVGSTGLSNYMIEVVEIISRGNIIILLFMVMVLCLILGLGLPTTANYLVVAALMAHVVVEVGGASGYIFPLIAVHLYVFYFGLMADITPPVGLASYAAAAISRADPIKTGIQAFWYSLRTGILPIVFIFNSELLLIGIESIWHGLIVIITSLIAILVFTAATQGWFITKLRWYEIVVFILISLSLFRPDYVLDKFYPKYEYTQLQISNLQFINLKPDRDVHIRITRRTEYGDRYKLFVINKDNFKENYSLEDYGINLVDKEGRITIDTLKWDGLAKKSGVETGDVVTEFKVENLERPNKAIVYPFVLMVLFGFGYLNYKRKSNFVT